MSFRLMGRVWGEGGSGGRGGLEIKLAMQTMHISAQSVFLPMTENPTLVHVFQKRTSQINTHAR